MKYVAFHLRDDANRVTQPQRSGRFMPALFALALTAISPVVCANGVLENPIDFGDASGISIVSGWHCDANTIEIMFDGYDPVVAPYGSGRDDTMGVCGDTDNGFALLFNWNLLGDGFHTVRALADGLEFANHWVYVHTLGEEFVQGIELRTELTSLAKGKSMEISWEQARQGFVLTHVEDADITMQDIITVLSGNWTGDWVTPGGGGTVAMTFADDGTGQIDIPSVQLTGTGCAADGMAVAPGINVNDPLIEVVMSDTSQVNFEFMVTESMNVVGGAFRFVSGACEDDDGFYRMFKN
jgi:hypothetical protein